MNRDTWCVLWSHVIAKTRVVKWFRDNGFNLCKGEDQAYYHQPDSNNSLDYAIRISPLHLPFNSVEFRRAIHLITVLGKTTYESILYDLYIIEPLAELLFTEDQIEGIISGSVSCFIHETQYKCGYYEFNTLLSEKYIIEITEVKTIPLGDWLFDKKNVIHYIKSIQKFSNFVE